MTGMSLLSVLAAGSKRRLRVLILGAALALAGAASASVGLGFATFALFEAVRLRTDAIDAALAVSGLYFLLAAIFFLLRRRVATPRRVPETAAPAAQDAPIDPLGAAAGAPQAAAIAMGAELARQLTPLQLTLLAALSGFVAGRRL